MLSTSGEHVGQITVTSVETEFWVNFSSEDLVKALGLVITNLKIRFIL